MSKRDYYEILGVARTADEAELKSAFRKLAMKWHPDRNPGNEEAEVRFKELNEAYQTLSDPQKRGAYDRFGHAAFEQGGGMGGFSNDFGSSMSDIFEDLFGEMTGRGRRQQAGGRGDRIYAIISKSLWKMPIAARPRPSRFRWPSAVKPAAAAAPNQAASPSPAPPVAAMVGCGPRKAFSRLNAPARIVRDAARPSTIPAAIAAGRVARPANALCR